jgi:flagellar basal body P-ring formation protein FlgA
MMRKGLTFLALATLLLLAPGARAVAPAPTDGRISLRRHVTLNASRLTLADLLPATAPESLRKATRGITLGAAPQPPGSRILYRQQLRFLLSAQPNLLSHFDIPDEVVVRRSYRLLTRKEVIQAIQTALGNEGAQGLGATDLSHVRFSFPVYVTKPDPGLRVIRIECEPSRGETRFRLWTAGEPAILPFDVTVRRTVNVPTLVARHTLAPGEVVSASDFTVALRPAPRSSPDLPAAASDFQGLEPRTLVRKGQPVDRNEFGQAVLVQPDTLATLIVQGGAFNIKTMVTPLQQGVMGQEIRVRNIESRQVVEARVAGRDLLVRTKGGF